MIHTRICDLLGITHPIVLGGMGSATSASLVAEAEETIKGRLNGLLQKSR